jgi:tetratricopeptide (TPR) repeat protein
MEWLEALQKVFGDLGWLANAFDIVQGACTFAIAALTVLLFCISKFRRDREEREALRKLLEAAQSRNDDLSRELATARSNDPCSWIKTANEEVERGNREGAFAALRSGLSRVQDSLYEAHFRLARHHASTSPDGGLEELLAAQRFARIAVLLQPASRQAMALLAEIDAAIADRDAHSCPSIGGDEIYTPPRVDLPESHLSDSEATERLVRHLAEATARERESGRNHVCEAIADRARSIAERRIGLTSAPALNARHMWASALLRCGRTDQALEEIEKTLALESVHTEPVEQRATGLENTVADIEAAYAKDPLLREGKGRLSLELRHLHAILLRHLGRYQNVLVEVDSLLEDTRLPWVGDHPYRLSLQALRGAATGHLGQPERGLSELDEVICKGRDILGDHHPTMVRARCDRASVTRLMERAPKTAGRLPKPAIGISTR